MEIQQNYEIKTISQQYKLIYSCHYLEKQNNVGNCLDVECKYLVNSKSLYCMG